MAEGTLGGILGDEDEKAEVEAPEGHASAEAFAAAVAAIASRQDPGVARRTEEFLGDQSHLLKIQAQHLEDEHALRLAHLRNQVREENVRRLGLRLRVGLQIFVALLASVIGAGLVILLHDAVTSHNVVIEPFDAPPALAAHGVTGKVVASGLLDELNRLQSATLSSAAPKRELSNAWSREIKLDVPDTGISLGEISRLLKERFGHDVRINGDLIQTDTGDLALTVRGDRVPAKTFTGTPRELAILSRAAAEYVYAQSEPPRWAAYLVHGGRFEDGIAFCRAAITRADPTDRPYLLLYWATALRMSGGALDTAMTLLRDARTARPDFWITYTEAMTGARALGQEETAWRIGEDLRKAAGGRPGRADDFHYVVWDALTWNLSGIIHAYKSATADSGNFSPGFMASIIGSIEALRHDHEAAARETPVAEADSANYIATATTHFQAGVKASEAGDIMTAANEMELFGEAMKSRLVSSLFPGYTCWVAPADEAAGRTEKADAILQSGGTFVDCFRFRGDILDHRGDWEAAQKAYVDSAALAPDLPAAYYSWGVALARHGDLARAEAKLKDANQRGPHWADPLKAWGDVMVKQGKTKEALAKYDEALKYAPNWKQLKEAREAAAKHTN
jgi:hypothetical protein